MKILEFDEKKQRIRLIPESLEDLYYLTFIICKDDILYSWTKRTIKIERAHGVERGEKVKVYLGIKVESLEFSEFMNRLRVKGVIIHAPEDWPIKGQYHTIIIDIGKEIVLEKNEIFKFQMDILKKSCLKTYAILVVSIGEDESVIGLLRSTGFIQLAEITRDTTKDESIASLKKLYKPYIRKVLEYVKVLMERYGTASLIVLYTSIVKPLINEVLSETSLSKIVKNIRLFNVSEGGVAGIYEFLRRENLDKIFRNMRFVYESQIVDEIYKRLMRDDKRLAIGLREVKFASEIGAIDKLIITDRILRSLPENENLKEIVRNVEKTGGSVIIIKEDSEHGLKLKSLGGIAALTKFNVRDIISYSSQ